ncbi:MAG: hypothetical protein Q9226_004543 [Calogaya cf. arnoldii]
MMYSIPSRRGLLILRNVSCRKASAFSTSTSNWKAPPRRSPTVRVNERARQKGLPPPPPPEKWPMKLLEYYVANAGWLASVTLKDVMAILDDFEALGLAMAKLQAKAICSEYSIEPRVLWHLGDILLDYNDVKYRDVATTLLICTLESGDPNSSFFAAGRLLNDAMLTGRHKGPGVALARKAIRELRTLQMPAAVYQEGKLLEHEGKPLEALQLYQIWSDKEIEYRKGPNASPHTIYTVEHGDICKALARLRAKLGDRSGAEEAIRDAAFVYDDPAAYYHLAVEFVPPGSKEVETYLLKAASSDQPRASHALGMLYFTQSRQGILLSTPDIGRTIKEKNPSRNTMPSATVPVEQYLSKVEVSDKRAEAMEWFEIAAESGITASQIYLALLLREAGRADEGLEWLQKAARTKDAADWMEGIEYFKKMWRLSDPDPMLMDIESLRTSTEKRKTAGVSILASLDDADFMNDPWQGMEKVDGRWTYSQRPAKKFRERLAASWR